jgi:hypothetical protein
VAIAGWFVFTGFTPVVSSTFPDVLTTSSPFLQHNKNVHINSKRVGLFIGFVFHSSQLPMYAPFDVIDSPST